MALRKSRRRGLHHLFPVSIVISFYLIEFFIFCELNVWVRKSRIKMKRSLKVLKRKPQKVCGSWGLMKISGQNILREINEGKSPLEMHGDREQMQQCVQDNGRGPGLAGYAIWKSDTKSTAWVSSDAGIHLDSSPVSSYPSQIILYRSLYVYQQSILESTIQEISYLGFLSIMTGAGASCILSEKVLDVVGLSMDTWKTGWTEHMNSGSQRVNNRVLDWEMIS